jgi:TRAP-type uncharacterized transport system substrate-binding protein
LKKVVATALSAAIAIASVTPSAALAQAKPTIPVVTAEPEGGYWKAAVGLGHIFSDLATLQPLASPGPQTSVAAVVRGSHPLALVQADFLPEVQRQGDWDKITVIGKTVVSYVFVVCETGSGINSTADLQTKSPRPRVLVGQESSREHLTLLRWIEAEPGFANIAPDFRSAAPAAGGVEALTSGEAQCALVSSTLADGTMGVIDKASQGKLKLINANDWDLSSARTPDGETIYSFATLTSAQFPGLIRDWFGLMRGSISTPAQPVYLIANGEWAVRNADFAGRLGRVLRTSPDLVE